MKINYLKSKDNKDIISVDSVLYHSTYNPEKEAERFVSSIQADFNPSAILIIEPGLSFCLKFFKDKFPAAKIGKISIIDEIENEGNWDFIINYSDFTNKNGQNPFTNNFNESDLLNTLLIDWPTCKKIFNKESNIIWKFYKESLEYAKTLLVTRTYFEKKWLINSINFFKYTKSIVIPKKGNHSIVIAASGPSLKKALPLLKKYRNNIILIGLSSAIKPLLYNSIIPDFCISTDGGYWAKKHLYSLLNKNIPLAVSSEANVPKKMLESLNIIPLCYEDGLSNKLFTLSKIPFMKAERNGTVSGTAFELAKSLSNNPVYFCGLDLKETTGFQHTQPNELENENSLFDNRINTKDKRLYRSELPNDSLKIYRDWFCQNGNQQIIRVIEDDKNPQLGSVKDINIDAFEKILKDLPEQKISFESSQIDSESQKKILADIEEFIKTNNESDDWKEYLFPIDYVAINHCSDSEAKKIQQAKTDEKNSKLIEKIIKILEK